MYYLNGSDDTNDTRFQFKKDMDENLEWLTQNTEDPKSNKGNLT